MTRPAARGLQKKNIRRLQKNARGLQRKLEKGEVGKPGIKGIQ